MRLWLSPKLSLDKMSAQAAGRIEMSALEREIGILRHPSEPAKSWAYLRLAEFHNRPGHADLLHLDLWRRGLNLALDAGSYLYNAAPPWDNAFTRTQVHNTVLVDGKEQMLRAGRFLYLDWARTQVTSGERSIDGSLVRLVAQHNGYTRRGVIHQRTVAAQDAGGWLVEDHLEHIGRSAKFSGKLHSLCLQWLLPDWPWKVILEDKGLELQLNSPLGIVRLMLSLMSEKLLPELPQAQIIRAGQLVWGEGDISPTWGWSSPHYGDKIPALAVRYKLESQLPVVFSSQWSFPD